MGGTSSKSVFAGIVKTLLEKDVESTDHEFWDEMWKTVLSVEEIFESISADDVRKIITNRPENMKTLFTQAVAQLYQVVETPYPIYFDQALNCSRVLARVLPFLLESDEKAVKDLLWNRRFVKGSQDDSKSAEGAVEDVRESEPLAVILVNTIFHLLFLPDFTIEDPNVEFNENDVNSQEFKAALMWAPGVGSSEKTVVSSTQFDTNRIDILRLLIAAFSDSLYQNADTYDSCASMWLEVGTSVDAPYAEIVFYSLMNTVLGYDPIGWGVPYGNLVSTDTAKLVMESAVQALVILLDFGLPVRLDTDSSSEPNPVPYVAGGDTEAQGFNVFRRLLSSIQSPDQLNFIYKGFVRLLNNVHQAESTYLPYSITRIGIEQELLVLLWKCLEEIPKFMPYVLKHCDVTEILVPICYFMLEGRRDPAKVGLMYLCTFTLLKLSGERNFGVSLNKTYQLQLPVDVPLFAGNHADLLIVVLHKLIVSGLEKLSPLYNCFLTIICNVSPYCKSLCTVAAVKLVNLLQLFVSPTFLYASEANHVYVGLLLETLNNLVQYQYEGNGNVIYAIIRRREIFDSLNTLTLPLAIKGAKELSEGGVSTQPAVGSGAKKKVFGTLGGKKSSEESLELYAEGAPTDLVSTHNVERVMEQDVPVNSPAAAANVAAANVAAESTNSDAAESTTGPGAEEAASETGNSSSSSAPSQPVAPQHTHRFVPTEAWLQSVKAEMPLNTISRLLKHLTPQLEELSVAGQGLDESKVLEFLRSTTMVGLLPVPHPIVIRKYQPNKYTCLWFTAFQWGVIFMHNQAVPLFDGKHVKLFIVQTAA